MAVVTVLLTEHRLVDLVPLLDLHMVEPLARPGSGVVGVEHLHANLVLALEI